MGYINLYCVERYVNRFGRVQWNVKLKGHVIGSYSYYKTRKKAVAECKSLNDKFNGV